MRTLFARIIVVFARLATFPFFGPIRRADALQRAGTRLLEGTATEVDTKEGRLFFAPDLRLTHAQAAGFQAQEPDTVEWIDAFSDDTVFWDIGANIGTFALYAGLKPAVRVLAFEPAASSFAVLNRNIELNSLDRITAYCIAFAGDTRLASLNMASTSPGASMHGFGTERNQFGGAIDVNFRQGAVGFSIDDFVTMFSPLLPTHVKVDVDGIEADILRGGRRTLSAQSVRSMIVEVERDLNTPHNREILGLMAEFGFTARPKASPGLLNVIFDRN